MIDNQNVINIRDIRAALRLRLAKIAHERQKLEQNIKYAKALKLILVYEDEIQQGKPEENEKISKIC